MRLTTTQMRTLRLSETLLTTPRVERDLWRDFSNRIEARQIGEVDFAVVSFGPPAPALRARVEIAQVGIHSEQTDEVQVEAAAARDELVFGERAVKDRIAYLCGQVGGGL